VREFQRSLRVGCERGDFRVLHYSLQRDHAHLLVEADSQTALARGMKSVGARLARAINRVFARAGAVLDGRYHLHLLRTPREVRNALAYVLLNARKHWRQRFGIAPPPRIDEASSARWFDGWNLVFAVPRGEREVAEAQTWLVHVGWRRHGLVDLDEIPAR